MNQNLVSTFIEVVTLDGSLAQAIRAMNATLNARYTNSRLREWERGDRQPTLQVVDYMLGIVLPWLLEQEGISQDAIDRLVQRCRLPQ